MWIILLAITELRNIVNRCGLAVWKASSRMFVLCNKFPSNKHSHPSYSIICKYLFKYHVDGHKHLFLLVMVGMMGF